MFFGGLLALALLEGALRLFGPYPTLDHEHLLPGSPFRAHPDFIMAPGSLLRPEFYASEQRRSGGRPLVVCLGDSFTQGYPVEPADSYPAQLERLVPQACFVNIGIGDSGPDQQLAFFQRWVLPRLKPDLVIWAFYSNDINDNWRTPVYDIDRSGRLVFTGGADHWIVRRDRLVRSSRLLRGLLRHTYAGRHLLQAMRRPPRPQEPQYQADVYRWALSKTRLELEAMRQLAREEGFPLLVARIAPQHYYSQGSSDDYAALVAAIEPSDVDIVFPSAQGVFCDDGRDGNPLGDHHFNEQGYGQMARRLVPQVLARLGEKK